VCAFLFFSNRPFVLTLKQIIIQKSYVFYARLLYNIIYIHTHTHTTYAYYNANRSKSTAIITRYYNVYLRVPTRIQISKTHTHDIIHIILYIYIYICIYVCGVIIIIIIIRLSSISRIGFENQFYPTLAAYYYLIYSRESS